MQHLMSGLLAARRTAVARAFLVTMLASGGVPNEAPDSPVLKSTYKATMMGVDVTCTLYKMDPHEWAEVQLRGVPFGLRGVRGRAWNVAPKGKPRKIELERDFERALRNRGAQLLAVYPLKESDGQTILVDIRLPIIGKQVIALDRVQRWQNLGQ